MLQSTFVKEYVMWRCPKCSKISTDGSKICRQCGAIMEEIFPDENAVSAEVVDVPDLTGDSQDVSPRVLPTDVAESDETESDEIRVEGKPPVVMPVSGDQSRDSEFATGEGTPWRCGRCLEDVPGTFDLCWKCGASRDGMIEAQFVSESSDAEESLEVNAAADVEDRAPNEGPWKCAKCGASIVMRGLRLMDQGQGSDGGAKVVCYGNPAALIFKDACYGEVVADVCGRCGYVELRVANVGELYQHFVARRQK